MKYGTERNVTTSTAHTTLSGVPNVTDASSTKTRKTMKNEIPIVIPYWAGGAQGNELELAVTGWRKYFIEDYHIFIVGDPHPVISTGDDISLIECPRIESCGEGNYLPHIDHVHKFTEACKQLVWDYDNFIYTCDDIYPVNDFSLIEILFPKVTDQMTVSDDDTDGWLGDLRRTKLKCIEEGLPTWDWVCHLPVLYNIYELLQIYKKYDCANTSYVVENLYFNYIYEGRTPLKLNGTDNLKYAVDTNPYDLLWLEDALATKIFITNSPSGWSKELEDGLRKHYSK